MNFFPEVFFLFVFTFGKLGTPHTQIHGEHPALASLPHLPASHWSFLQAGPKGRWKMKSSQRVMYSPEGGQICSWCWLSSQSCSLAMVLHRKLLCLYFHSCLYQYISVVPCHGWISCLWRSLTLLLKRGKSVEQHLARVEKCPCGLSGFFCSADRPANGSLAWVSVPSDPGKANYNGLLRMWGKLKSGVISSPAEEGMQDSKVLKMLENNTSYLFTASWFPHPTSTIVPLWCS